jgi:hypothetical protein
VEAMAGHERHMAPLALHNRHDSVAICPAEMEPDGGLTANF